MTGPRVSTIKITNSLAMLIGPTSISWLFGFFSSFNGFIITWGQKSLPFLVGLLSTRFHSDARAFGKPSAPRSWFQLRLAGRMHFQTFDRTGRRLWPEVQGKLCSFSVRRGS